MPNENGFIVDAHLDLAYNALRGRDVLRPAAQQPADREGIPTVGLPDLHAGGVGLICATVFCMPSLNGKPGYQNPAEACAIAGEQMAWYRAQSNAGHFRLVRTADDLPRSSPRPAPSDAASAPLPIILLMEGPDALRTPDDLPGWFDAGLRVVGLAWKRTRFAGGTGTPGPLTPEGLELVRHLDRFGVIHDASHLAEESFWQLLERSDGPVMASHSNCRAFVPTDRQLSDDMIRAIVRRGGVIGINFYDKFLLPPDEYKKRPATLRDLVRHADHICQIAGNAHHVALGTDLDGGLGRGEIPEEIVTAADLPKVADALRAAGYGDADVRGVMGENWLRFFRRHLPPAPRR